MKILNADLTSLNLPYIDAVPPTGPDVQVAANYILMGNMVLLFVFKGGSFLMTWLGRWAKPGMKAAVPPQPEAVRYKRKKMHFI